MFQMFLDSNILRRPAKMKKTVLFVKK